jgi:hypothetical protein
MGDLMVLAAGLGVGLWLFVEEADKQYKDQNVRWLVLMITSGVLGGLAVVGPPLLLAERRKAGRPWGPGKIYWFASGTAAWLLWPPVVVRRAGLSRSPESTSAFCFAYGTPLMALYLTAALLAGGWLGRKGRRRLARSWREQFGLGLGLLWACTGLYVLWLIYEDDLWK